MKRSVIACLLGLAMVPALAGCSGEQAGASIASPPPAAKATLAPGAATAAPIVQTPPAASVSPATVEATPQPDTHQEGKTAQTLASSSSADAPSGSLEQLPSYSPGNPVLVGITLGESQATVEGRFGKPKTTYSMDGDGGSPVQVDDFGTFSVGFDESHAVLFVDVSSAELDPRLNGLRLGQTADDARKALGKPDSSSAYVLSYESKKTVLKLDLDPRTKAILSIKLFGRTE